MDLRQLERALAAFSVLSPTSLPVHHAQVFLFVARHGPCSYEALEEALALSNSTVSRTVHALGDQHRKGYDGYGLLELARDPEEGRRYLVSLTAKGKALLRQLEGL
jgi:DNA-binding MarR family transcriptional regulator